MLTPRKARGGPAPPRAPRGDGRGSNRAADRDLELQALDRRLADATGAVSRGTVEVEVGRQGLADDVGLVLAGDLEHLRVPGQPQHDPVGHLEARLFAGELDRADDLPRQPLAAELLV